LQAIDSAKSSMKLLNSKFLPIVFSIFLVVIFFWQFFFKGLLPIPSDTIIGLYHPYRDLYAKDYPRGITFKNFLITDPVRQQYPWKNLSIDLLKKGKLPLWNPYTFSGTPLLANFQSSAFYPLNIIFLIPPFNIGWSILIILEVFLGSLFMFLYLNNLKLSKWASILGSLVFSFSGFSVAWLTWGTIIHTILWLPLILLSVDKIASNVKHQKLNIKNVWGLVFLLSLVSSFFAGHLQIFSYVLLVSIIYFFFRFFQYGRQKKTLLAFATFYLLFAVITAVQLIPTLQFISESARSIDQSNWQKLGWFVPWQHLLQFVIPDFFGNPATLNYWGVFNYGEFIGYAGVVPFTLAIFALFFRKNKTIFLFGCFFFLALIFALPTPLAKLPYILNLPLISTAQPTRLIFIVDFSLAVLSAFGLDLFLKEKRKIIYPLVFLIIIYSLVWLSVLFTTGNQEFRENMLVAKNNLILPTLIFATFAVVILVALFKKTQKFTAVLIISLIVLTGFDLFRFAWKFEPFTKKEYLFPNTKVLNFLQNQKGQFRVMTTDARIFSPNFSTVYKIQSIEGYDPLYIQRYGEFIAALERGRPEISGPFGFDRIITPHNIDSELINLLGVKYILSLSDISNKNFEKVFSEGETQVYENKNVLPRAFFVNDTVQSIDKNQSIKLLFSNKNSLDKTAIVENFKTSRWNKGVVQIKGYEENKVVLDTKNEGDGFLVLTDSFYPTWHVRIDGEESEIIRADYNFRGVFIPKGNHTVEFYITLF